MEMGLIGRNYNLVGQILKISRIKKTRRKRREYSVKRIVDGQKYSKSTKKDGE